MDLEELKKKLREEIPKEYEVVDINAEGPNILIETKNIELFLNNEQIIKNLASTYKKKFIIRSDPSTLLPPEQTIQKIKEIVPEDANISEIKFDPSFNEICIEAEKLGLIIGQNGETLKKIISETKWTPKLLRKPKTESEILKGIRETLIKESKEYKNFLKKTGKRIFRQKTKETDWVKITCFGGAREVGRSCFLLETPETKVLLDCGVNVASMENAFPLLNNLSFPIQEIDAVIISHGHLDHCGFLPYLFSYGYDGPVYTTTPTREVMALLQKDYLEVLEKNAKVPPYSEKDIKNEILHTITRNYNEVTDISPDMRITFYNAGHILGSAMVHIHIGEGLHNILYTGDFKFGYTELLNPAESEFPRLETLIMESTYGSPQDVQMPRYLGEKKMMDLIHETIEKNGIVLIPSFAVERAQEIMLVIAYYARKNNWDIPVYLDGMIKEASAIHTVYPEFLKKNVQREILHGESPFDMNIFQNVDKSKRDEIIENGRCVILAPSGMMNGGPVMEYFRKIAEDERNALLFAGYQAEGSLGRRIQRGEKEIPLEDEEGKLRTINVKMKVESVDCFSGHADVNQLLGFVKKVFPKPKLVLTVHGEEKKCVSLAKNISYKFKVETSSPRNLDSVRVL
ncbi:MAG: beta-CASP ribonuclease aCPSF1 [archaeon]